MEESRKSDRVGVTPNLRFINADLMERVGLISTMEARAAILLAKALADDDCYKLTLIK